MMTDHELADELIRQATLIRLGQKKFSTRAKLLLTATFFDNEHCDLEGNVRRDTTISRPLAFFPQMQISPTTLHSLQQLPYRRWDTEIELTMRIHDPSIHPQDIVHTPYASPLIHKTRAATQALQNLTRAIHLGIPNPNQQPKTTP